jgi:hypothetical protein
MPQIATMRRYAPLTLLLVIAACGDSYNPPPLYQASSPDCATLLDGDSFPLPRGIVLSATTATPQPDGSVDIGVNYMLPRTTQIKFATSGFLVSEPKGRLLQKAEIVTVYQRPTNQKPEIVELVNGTPMMLISVATSDDTQFRYRLRLNGKLPPRFDLQTPDYIVGTKRYQSRIFTYRWDEGKHSYSMCR